MSNFTSEFSDHTSDKVVPPTAGEALVSAIGPSVLLLDDDPLVAETLSMMARSFGARVRVSLSAAEFFQQWDLSAPDVAIIDLQMPGQDGLGVIRQLGTIARAQVILSSGSSSRVLDAACHAMRDSGLIVVGVLPKPVRRAELKKLLAAVQTRNGTTAGSSQQQPSPIMDIDAVRGAMTEGQIHPHFQPKLRLRDGVLDGFEALARLEHPELGLISPDVFLPLIHAHGLIWQLTELMVNESLELLSQLPQSGLTMAVNVPLSVCAEASFAEFLRSTLAKYDLQPADMIVELTEAGPIEIAQGQIDALTRLRMQGFGLSIDDFGTGASSIERLVRIPFSEMKIDRYFVKQISTSAAAEQLVKNMVQIASAMEMSVTIEGIEDAETMRLAERLGIDLGQGYYIARPIAKNDLSSWMTGHAKSLP